MEQNPHPAVIDEEQAELAFQLLFDWYANALQALVDAAGNEKATELLRPYFKNASIASIYILNETFGLGAGDSNALNFFHVVIFNFMARVPTMEISVYEKGDIAKVSNCPFKQGPIVHCALFCNEGPNMQAETLGIVSTTRLVSSLSQGDSECRWITRFGRNKESEYREDLGVEIANVLNWQFPKEMVDSFCIQYYAEFWVIATRALIDHIGELQATFVLKPYMKHRGISFGLKGSSAFINADSNLARISSMVDHCGRALQMKGVSSNSDTVLDERTIVECPFKDAPIQVCQQFEAFFNGICEAIDPSYEFVYDRMMTKGDKTCHWTIRKKLESQNELPSDDPINALALRLAKGEISLEEFENSIAALRKHGAIK